MSRRGSHWQKYGPLYLVSVAVPLIMADLTRHVLQGQYSGMCNDSAIGIVACVVTSRFRSSLHMLTRKIHLSFYPWCNGNALSFVYTIRL